MYTVTATRTAATAAIVNCNMLACSDYLSMRWAQWRRLTHNKTTVTRDIALNRSSAKHCSVHHAYINIILYIAYVFYVTVAGDPLFWLSDALHTTAPLHVHFQCAKSGLNWFSDWWISGGPGLWWLIPQNASVRLKYTKHKTNYSCTGVVQENSIMQSYRICLTRKIIKSQYNIQIQSSTCCEWNMHIIGVCNIVRSLPVY